MFQYPTLETERLTLRGWREADIEPLAAMMGDPEVAHFIGGVQSRSDAWRTMATFIGHWQLRGHGFWVVERKSDGAFIGRIGLWRPEGWPGLEVGWALARAYWGQGFASEAAKASLDYGFGHYPVKKLISTIHPDNRPSQRVAERLGETRSGVFEIAIFGRRYPVDIWEISRERWSARA